MNQGNCGISHSFIWRGLLPACGALIFLVSSVAFAADPNPPSIHSNRGAWPITRQWTTDEVRHYAQWIRHIYVAKTTGTQEQRLARLERVLTDPEVNLLLDPEFAGEGSNPQLDLGTIRVMHKIVDCHKLSVSLSTYYAYRRGLPWMISYVRSGDGADVRTADYTIPVGQMNSLEYASVGAFVRDALVGTCTGNYRVELNRDRSEFSDTLPVAISPEYLLPGCLFYMDGHVVILADVTAYGEPRFLDATTAASRDIYAFNGFNSVSGITPKRTRFRGREYEGCYHGFRVYRWPIAEIDDAGAVTRVRRRTDTEMKEFGLSTEQYDRLEELAATGRIVENNVALDSFHQFIRFRLRTANCLIPVAEIKVFARDMLALLEERERRVQAAWQDVQTNGPIPFPEDQPYRNVYTCGGRWTQYATAFTDTECRAKYFALADTLDNAIEWFDVRAEDVLLYGLNKHAIWTPADLAEALLCVKNRIFANTTLEYTNSAGQPVRLSLLDIEKRLFDLSFDPNHPPELRWGAPLGSIEARSAVTRNTPLPDGTEVPMKEAYRRQAY
ncbi:MAG: hypothetical protein U9Q79_06690, partial [Candidatus Hydrogenedentes bacterium]|nr:hypothetical protein [Candidatus Hydrogenedentota bacterium]